MAEAEKTGVASTLGVPETPGESAIRAAVRRIVNGLLGTSFVSRFPSARVASSDESVRSIVVEATGREPDSAATQEVEGQLANAS